MPILSAIDSSGLSAGSIGSVLDSSRAQRTAEKAEAVAKAKSASANGDVDTKLRGVAEEFVSVFMNQVMKSMRATVNENPEMHGDNGEKFFQEMLDTEQSKSLAKGSGYGLTDLVYQALAGRNRVVSAAPGMNTGVEGTAAVATM